MEMEALTAEVLMDLAGGGVRLGFLDGDGEEVRKNENNMIYIRLGFFNLINVSPILKF